MNAKEELLKHIGDREVEYVRVIRNGYRKTVVLEGTLDEVLPRLDFKYDSGCGSQKLEGTIWYSDGTWSERVEYDGSEWWEHRECPPLPNAQVGAPVAAATGSRIPERLYLMYAESSCDGRVPARYRGRTDDINEAIAFAVKHESDPYTSVMVRMITATESRLMNSSEMRELKRHTPANDQADPLHGREKTQPEK